MLILLPPSEGKTSPLDADPVDLAALSFPGLTGVRRQVLSSLVRMCRSDPDQAARTLGLGVTQGGDVAMDARLRRAPSAPAVDVYTGVLFDSLGYATMSARARRRADSRVAIASALWGLVRPQDAIPAYRLSGGVSLPDLGALSRVWRPAVTAQIATAQGLIVDCRSSAYVALGPLPPSVAGRSAVIRVLQERDGRRSVVSHSNKATKGRLVRALLESPADPGTADDLAHVLAQAGFRVERGPDARGGGSAGIDVIVEHA